MDALAALAAAARLQFGQVVALTGALAAGESGLEFSRAGTARLFTFALVAGGIAALRHKRLTEL